MITPDSTEVRPIYGEDSLQAICLGLRFLARRIDDLITQGWQFLYETSREPISFENYFLIGTWEKKLEEIGRQMESDSSLGDKWANQNAALIAAENSLTAGSVEVVRAAAQDGAPSSRSAYLQQERNL